MHNYEKQFIQLIKTGKYYFYNTNESNYFYFLFHNTQILGTELEYDRCKKFYQWDAYNETKNRNEILSEEDALYSSRLAQKELDLLSVMGMTTWLAESYTGHNYFSKVVATPEALSHVLVTWEEAKDCKDDYYCLTARDWNNLRMAYRQADLIERVKEAKVSGIDTKSKISPSQLGFLFDPNSPSKS